MRVSLPNKLPRLWSSERGASAAEFALVLPLLLLLTFGSLGVVTMMYTTAGMHFAAESAARCAAVSTTCANAGSTSAYALGKYAGPQVTGLAFTLTTAACGQRVAGTGTYVLRTGLANINVPVSAVACYPKAS
jgi:Flp pilus assembly protein TadG